MWTRELTTRQLFFTGKGGVGKTSLACATALDGAQQGMRTLIVSTDPASNLDEVFQTELGPEPRAITGVENLWAANLDPEAAAAAYREKVVGPYRGKLPEAVIRNMEEQFSGACTTEIAAFDEFVRLMADADATVQFDRIVFDTAPTGHTLRLLSLPSAWSGYLETTTAESSCLGPLAGLQDQRKSYEIAFRKLANPDETTVVLVARPEASSLREAARTMSELLDLDIRNLHLMVNAVYEPTSLDDPIAREYREAGQAGLASMPAEFAHLPKTLVPMLPGNVVGLDAIRALTDPSVVVPSFAPTSIPDIDSNLDHLIDQLAAEGHGVVMTMGKGGVGKTTVAARLAEALAARGHDVLLTTTDPAGNLDTVAAAHGRLQVSRIDPAEEVRRYTQATLDLAAQTLDPQGLELLREDLRSPCTEEIAVFRAFAEIVSEGVNRFVVIDTAPTGHTILLMDATESYHRDVARTQSDAPESVRELLPRLRDPKFTKVVLVALPEPTPVHEALHLAEDLKRAGIQPFGWVVNRSLSARNPTEPILAAKAAAEAAPMREVMATELPMTVLPWTSPVREVISSVR